MAINVNTVYRTVLSLANREQRGFVTPDQYNRLARLAQLDLFEKAFFDYNRFLTRQEGNTVNDEYANLAKATKEKIDVFSTSSTLSFNASGTAAVPSNFYKCIMISTGTRGVEVQEVQKSDLPQINSSKLTAPSSSYPVYYREADNIKILPTSTSSATLDYIFKPADPIWGFTTGATYGDIAYASGSSVNFQLHDSEEEALVTRILQLSGIIIESPGLVEIAMTDNANTKAEQNN